MKTMNSFERTIWSAAFIKFLSDQAYMHNVNHSNLVIHAIDRANEIIRMLDYNRLVDHPHKDKNCDLVLLQINGLDE